MLPYEQYHLEQLFQQSYESDSTSTDSYTAAAMDYNFSAATYPNTMAYAWNNDFSMLQTEMARTSSNTSMQRPTHEYPPAISASVASASSSTVGSPYSGYTTMAQMQDSYAAPAHNYISQPAIVTDDLYSQGYTANEELYFPDDKSSMFFGVGESLYPQPQYGSPTGYPQPSQSEYSSPAPSHHSYNYSASADYTRSPGDTSGEPEGSPRPSVSGDEKNGEKGRCPHPECGRVFKDLKAHMLTHQSRRPEKCPIPTCEYHIKGFSRKYDKNRHTLTHYKGTMICGFCPGSGSPGEKLFNRADTFKRHLTAVHNVEQTAPNSRKRSPSSSNKKLSSYCQDATGKCSTCSALFNNAQDFYEHLDDCVLRVVQQEDPSEKINEQRLSEVTSDPALKETFTRHMIKLEEVPSVFNFEDNDDEALDDEDDCDEDEDEESADERGAKGIVKSVKSSSNRAVIGSNISKKPGKKNTMTWSHIGVKLVAKGRRRRKHYPPSWGMSPDKMKMKKRVLCVYGGPERLVKDDMMLKNEYEVRMRLPNSDHYVTDLDVETLKRANAFHEAPEEEKAWIQEQDIFDLMS